MNDPSIELRALEICETLFAIDTPLNDKLIADHCGPDEHLLRRVKRLLDCDLRARREPWLDQPPEIAFKPMPVGARIAGRFTITKHVGGGGHGDVYEAESEDLAGATVALKILNPLTTALGEKAIERFIREAKNAAQLQHPNIVPVFSAGEDDGLYFYAMQLIRGLDLTHYIKDSGYVEGKRSAGRIQDIVSMALQVARGLDHAHEMGFIHRDIKPANLLLDHGRNVWITDFGLAQLRSRSEQPGSVTQLAGTLRYMSPEQVSRGRLPIDVHTDLYSLGVTIYELLVGRPPFTAKDPNSLLHSISNDDPLPLRCLNPAVPPELESIVLQAMAKDAQERYPSARELADDLHRFRAGELVKAGQDNFEMARTNIRVRLQSITESAISMLDRWAMLEPAMAETQLALLQASVNSLEHLIKNTTARGDRIRIVESCRRVGEILHRLGRPEDALLALKKARRLLLDVHSQAESETARCRQLARLELITGIVLIDHGEHQEAVQTLGVCLETCRLYGTDEKAEVDQNNLQVLAAAAHLNSAVVVVDPTDAENHLRHAVAICKRLNAANPSANIVDPQLWLALSLYRLGFLLETSGRSQEGDPYYRDVLKILQNLTKANPGLGWNRLLSRKLLSDFLAVGTNINVFRRPELEPLYRLSIDAMERLSHCRQVPEYRLFLSIRHSAYGQLLSSLKRFDEAVAQFNSACRTYDLLISEFGELPEYLEGLVITYLDLADTLSANNQPVDAERMRESAVELHRKLVANFPQIPPQALISSQKLN